MIDVQQRTLCSLQYHTTARIQRITDDVLRTFDVRTQLRRPTLNAVQHILHVQRLTAVNLRDQLILELNQRRQLQRQRLNI